MPLTSRIDARILVLPPPPARDIRAFAADDRRDAAASEASAAATGAAATRSRSDPGGPRERQVLDVGLIDLCEMTVALPDSRRSKSASRFPAASGYLWDRDPVPRRSPAVSKEMSSLISVSSFQGHQISSQVVDIFVGIHLQQLAMRRQRIVDFDFRLVAVAAEGALHAVGVGDGDDEVVDTR